ncbi:MAG: hypothetical protein L3K26_07880 [Candidatus Hydrogenedentes bacterium]|nr:hypothetical protein [Candidatus Hydrogenedentota bacterium]
MVDTQETLEHGAIPQIVQPALRRYTKLGFYEGTFVVGDTHGIAHNGDPIPYQFGQLKCNAAAELTEEGLSIFSRGTPLTIAPAQIRGVILNGKGTSKSAWGCERVLNVIWEKNDDYLCTVLVIMYLSKCLPRDWKEALESLARKANAPKAPEVILERVRQGFFDHKALNILMRNIFFAAWGLVALILGCIWAVRALVE